VIFPTLPSRVEEVYEPTAFSIERTDIAPFPCIAAKTGIRQILSVRSSAMFAADDVIYLMRRVGIVFVKETILTAMTGALSNESSQRVAYVIAQAACVDALAPSP
jgi:hypothetical protein